MKEGFFLVPTWRPDGFSGTGAGGGSGASGGVGAGGGGAARGKSSETRDGVGGVSGGVGYVTGTDSKGGAVVSIGAGGIGVVTGGIWFALTPRSKGIVGVIGVVALVVIGRAGTAGAPASAFFSAVSGRLTVGTGFAATIGRGVVVCGSAFGSPFMAPVTFS